MDSQTLLGALFLGVVEGLTEFVPVSSTGHLILLVDLLGFDGPPGRTFEIAVQFGAILAICWIYRAKLFGVALAFLPAMVLGFTLHGFIKNVLFDPWVVSIALIAGGVAILWIERNLPVPVHREIDAMTPWLAFKIGCCQVLAMIPGVSRSGATIMGALLMRVERKTATEFSFFLAIPTMLGATVYDLYKNRANLTLDDIHIIGVGFAAAFVAAMLVVRWVVKFVQTHGFAPFGWYRIAIGSGMLALLIWRG